MIHCYRHYPGFGIEGLVGSRSGSFWESCVEDDWRGFRLSCRIRQLIRLRLIVLVENFGNCFNNIYSNKLLIFGKSL